VPQCAPTTLEACPYRVPGSRNCFAGTTVTATPDQTKLVERLGCAS
jgi:hypothetical protein